MSDENTLAEAVGRLTEENKQLLKELEAQQWKQSVASAKAFAITIALASAGAFVIGYPLWKVLTTSAQVDHCYIETVSTPSYSLKGSIDWREDPNLGSFMSIEDAKAQAARLNCSMGALQGGVISPGSR